MNRDHLTHRYKVEMTFAAAEEGGGGGLIYRVLQKTTMP